MPIRLIASVAAAHCAGAPAAARPQTTAVGHGPAASGRRVRGGKPARSPAHRATRRRAQRRAVRPPRLPPSGIAAEDQIPQRVRLRLDGDEDAAGRQQVAQPRPGRQRRAAAGRRRCTDRMMSNEPSPRCVVASRGDQPRRWRRRRAGRDKAEPRGLFGIGAGRGDRTAHAGLRQAIEHAPRRRRHRRRSRAPATAGLRPSRRDLAERVAHEVDAGALTGEACSRCSIIGAVSRLLSRAFRQEARQVLDRGRRSARARRPGPAPRRAAAARLRRIIGQIAVAATSRHSAPSGRRRRTAATGAAGYPKMPRRLRRDRAGFDQLVDRERPRRDRPASARIASATEAISASSSRACSAPRSGSAVERAPSRGSDGADTGRGRPGWRLVKRRRHQIDAQRALVRRRRAGQLDAPEPAIGELGDRGRRRRRTARYRPRPTACRAGSRAAAPRHGARRTAPPAAPAQIATAGS